MKERDKNLRDQVKLTNPEKMYSPTDSQGYPIEYEDADGRQLFNHARHNMTNYDAVLSDVRQKNGRVTGWEQKQVSVAAAEQVLHHYRNEHVKVIAESKRRGFWLKELMQKAGVGTISALSKTLDSLSDSLKQIAHLEGSQRSLQTWNDTYRVQRDLVKEILSRGAAQDQVDPSILDQVDAVYRTKSVNKAVLSGSDLLDLEKSEVLKLVRRCIKYTKLAD